MPFKSKAQRRLFYALAARGEISEEKVKEWEDATPKNKPLPEKVASDSTLALLVKAAASGAATVARTGVAKLAPSLATSTTGSFTQATKVQQGSGNAMARLQSHTGALQKGFANHVAQGKSSAVKIPTTMKPNVKIGSAGGSSDDSSDDSSDAAKGGANLVPGGKGRKKTLDDFDSVETRIGLKVEREHFLGSGMSEQEIHNRAAEIVCDHLTEDEHYYTKTKHDFREEIKKESAALLQKKAVSNGLLAAAAGLTAGVGGYLGYKALSSPAKATLGRAVKTPHKRLINNAIRAGKGNFMAEFEKADGSVVTRKIRPITAKGGVVVFHDYDKDALRSFRTDRLRSLSKTAGAACTTQLDKLGGGPGSGVRGDNTLPIGMKQSEHVSVGTRKALLDNMPFYEDTVDLDDITAVGQEKYVPAKLNRMVDDPEAIKKPIDLLKVTDPKTGSVEYHVIDGHHRFLAAKKKGVAKLRARIYEKRAES
jgi:hypothetical protein